jgi:hypothetical protein
MSQQSKILNKKNTNVIWRPTKKQLEFLKTGSIFEVAYLGGAGSGKSTVLLIDACRQMNYKDARAVVFRRTTRELRQLVDYSVQLYGKLGATYSSMAGIWTFPSGGRIYFSHMENPFDKYRHDGQEYNAGVYFDEITHFAEDMYLYLQTRCRSANPKLIPRVRCSGSPVGKYVEWVRRRFINNGAYKIYEDPDTKLKRMYIPANLDDNPYLQMADVGYESRLKMQGDKLYQALRYGDWSQIEGVAFPEMNVRIHKIPSYVPSESDIIIRGFDWGFAAPFATVWVAENQDKDLIVFKEWIGTKDGSNRGLMMSADQVAKQIKKSEESNNLGVHYAPSDPAMWSKQNVGDSIGQVFENEGLLMHKAITDRTQGTQQLHMRLRVDENLQKPRLFITEDCPITFETLQTIGIDRRNPEAYDTGGFDHAVDALRYAIMERTLGGDNSAEPEFFGERATINQPF